MVGHEVAHALEGSDFAEPLKQAVISYAKSKGEYDSLMNSLVKLYTGKPGYETDFQAKMERELVADLIGKYLFTDADFVRNLSVQNRNLFQRLFDEIKYLLRVAKAGSKEARQLEKIKKLFEEAYRNAKNTAPTDGAKSQNDNENKTETESIKEQLKRAQDKLNKMQPVADINVPKDYFLMDKAAKQNWIIEKLKSTNYQVNRKGTGVISFAKKRLKSAFNYFLKGSADEASFEALPAVLTKGIEISNRSEHKERGYGTITIAAPIVLNGKRGNMAIVVKKTDGNHYKVHRVLAPDGTVFQIDDTTREAESTPAGESPNNGSLATPINSASNDSLTQDNKNVNPKLSLSEDTGADQAEGKNTYSQDVAVEPAAPTVIRCLPSPSRLCRSSSPSGGA